MSESDPNIRKLRITGGQETLTGKKKRRLVTRKIGGASGASGTSNASGTSTASNIGPVASEASLKTIASVVSSVTGISDKALLSPITKSVGGNVKLEPKKFKVILEKNKSKKARVIPKETRKVKLAIHNIHGNIHKAKTIKKNSKSIHINEIKKMLKSHGLWKEGSTAPDAMLRGIYADFLTLQEKAL